MVTAISKFWERVGGLIHRLSLFQIIFIFTALILQKRSRTTNGEMSLKAAKNVKKNKPQQKNTTRGLRKKGNFVQSRQNEDGRENYVDDDDNIDGEDMSNVKPPGQPTISVVDMGHILRPLAFRRHTEWTVQSGGLYVQSWRY